MSSGIVTTDFEKYISEAEVSQATSNPKPIMLRNDSESNLSKYNPILLPGEVVVSDEGLIKVGDGGHCWNDLPASSYISDPKVYTTLIHSPLNSGVYCIFDPEGVCVIDELTESLSEVASKDTGALESPSKLLGLIYEPSQEVGADPIRTLLGPSQLVRAVDASTFVRFPNMLGSSALIINAVNYISESEQLNDYIHRYVTKTERLVLAGKYEITSVSGTTINVETKNDIVYEVWERIAYQDSDGSQSSGAPEWSIETTPWKLVDASYQIEVQDTFITDEEIEDIVGFGLEFANGKSF